MSGIYPDFLGNIGTGTGTGEPSIVYIEVPGAGGGSQIIKQITVNANVIVKKKKDIKIKVNLVS